jgi:hypothetical protein
MKEGRLSGSADQQVELVTRLPGSGVPGAEEIAALLKDRPDLDLAAVDLSALRDELGKERAELAERLAALARVYRLTARFDHVEPLLAAGLDSAEAISGLTEDEFIGRFGEQFGDREAARLHRKARRRSVRRAKRRAERSRQS